jgi:hypothetical protein
VKTVGNHRFLEGYPFKLLSQGIFCGSLPVIQYIFDYHNNENLWQDDHWHAGFSFRMGQSQYTPFTYIFISSQYHKRFCKVFKYLMGVKEFRDHFFGEKKLGNNTLKNTPLHTMIRYADPEIIEHFVKNYPDLVKICLNPKYIKGENGTLYPLQFANQFKRSEEVIILVKNAILESFGLKNYMTLCHYSDYDSEYPLPEELIQIICTYCWDIDGSRQLLRDALTYELPDQIQDVNLWVI